MTGNSQPEKISVLQRWSNTEAARLRDVFINIPRGQTLPSGRSWRSLVALILAILVLVCYALLLLLGLWACWSAFRPGSTNSVLRMNWAALAVLCLLFCWLARPRFQAREERLIRAEQTPELHALVVEVAHLLHAPVPRIIRIHADVNAFVTREGLPPQFSLTLGLPLIYGLRAQEFLSVLAHEIAHEVSGDPARGQWIGNALSMLGTLNMVLAPLPVARLQLSQLPVQIVRWVIFLPFWGLSWLFQSLLGEENQRAEFRADLIAAQIAGSEPALRTLDKLHFGNLLEVALQKQRSMPERPHAFLELRHSWDRLGPQQLEQQRTSMTQERLRLDASHPPTSDRIAVLSHHDLPGTLSLSQERADRIYRELTPYVAVIEREAFEEYQRRYNL